MGQVRQYCIRSVAGKYMLCGLDSKGGWMIGFDDFFYIVTCFGIPFGQVNSCSLFIPAVNIFFHEAGKGSFFPFHPGGTDNQGQFAAVQLQQGANQVDTKHIYENLYEDGVEILAGTIEYEAQGAVGAHNGFSVNPW